MSATSETVEFQAAQRRDGRAALRLWLPVLLGLLLAFGALEWVRVNIIFHPDMAGLDAYTAAVFGEIDGQRIHCQDSRDSGECETAYRAAGSPPAVLWLGNSQLHGVNRFHTGDVPASVLLHQYLAPKGRYLVAYSIPNGNLYEHRLLFEQLSGKYRVQTLLLAVCFDDLRETGIRDTISGKATAAQPKAKVSASLQPVAEDWLTDRLARRWLLWRYQPTFRGMSDYFAYATRNTMLGINAQTKRSVSEAAYQDKMTVLRSLLAEAKAKGVKVVLYAPPYRQDIPGPYVETEYRRFLHDLRGLADGDQVRVADLTTAVPGPEWGMLRDPLVGRDDFDFMHFTAEGHRRLATALEGLL